MRSKTRSECPLAVLLVGVTLGCGVEETTAPDRTPLPATAAASLAFSWTSVTPESQGMCGTTRQLGCTRTLADIWSRMSSPKYNTKRFIVIRNDKVIYDRGGTSAYPVYSSNKGLWGAPTLVHAMHSCGVDLSDRASKWLAGGAGSRWASVYPWSAITVEQLATHTAGICDYGNTSSVCRNENGDWQADYEQSKRGGTGYKYANDALTVARVRSEQNREPAASPGSVYEYSNLGHALLNYVVQQACGRKLTDIYASYIRQAGMGGPVGAAVIYTDGGRIWNLSAGTARWDGRDGAAVLRLAARLGIWNNQNIEPVRDWNEVTKITGNLPVASSHGRGVVYFNNSTDRWTKSSGHRRFSNEMFGHDGNFSTVFLADPLTGTTIVRQGENNANGASYLTQNGCQPGWTGTAPSCKPGTNWSNNWGVALDPGRESDYVAGRMMVTDPLQEAFFFPPPFCRMTQAGGKTVDKVTDVYSTPSGAGSVELIAEIRANPREGGGSSVVDRVEFYKEDGSSQPKLVGTGTQVAGDPTRYRLSLAGSSHGAVGSVMTYFASCVAKSTQDGSKKVPSYSRPVRVRRAS
ncbi:MAG TPA: serine hydrolase domain-containing protein [Gemmatimonadales bacterium]|nr:serine hydrolase domain-containing protein [Gemmatimonadales bacterium]